MARLSNSALRKQSLKGCRSARIADRGLAGELFAAARQSGDRKSVERMRRNALGA
jgi:hypothetical protein